MAAVVNSFIALPKATKYLTVALVSFSLIAGIRHYTTASVLDDGTGSNAPLVAWLNLVPGQFLWSPWTLATATFVESNILALALSTFSLTMAGRWLERQWGSKEFLKFFAVVTIGSNVVCLFVFMLFYGITGDVGTFLYTRINGMNALHEAMLVALMQMIPEHRVQFLAGKVSFRVKHLPMVFVTISQIILFLTPSAPMFLIQFGWLIGWVYLRFFKVTDGIKGDRSETFAFANFFPPFLQGPISKVSTIIFDALVSFGICSARGYDAVNTYGGTVPLPVHSRAEAERRRAMALAALDTRLATRKKDSSSPGGMSTPPIHSDSISLDMDGSSKPVQTQPPPTLVFDAPDDEEDVADIKEPKEAAKLD